jgi:tryptophan synthase alpha chain
MSRIGRTFSGLRKKGGKAFIPYIMAGDPTIHKTRELVKTLEDCGADIIELGVPFSDPLADGPTIQRAAQRALTEGVTLHSVLELVAILRRDTRIPIVLMTYYNPVFRYGEEKFVSDAAEAGVDGTIIPDLPPDEAGDLIRYAGKRRLDTIFLLAPTSTEERIKKVSRASSGFIYYVPITGITGSKLSIDQAIEAQVARIRNESGKPVAVGFGISTPEEASTISGFADGVIVGSAIVKRIENSGEGLKEYLLALREAIR